MLGILLGAGSGPVVAWPKSRYSRYEPAALAIESFPGCPSAPLRPGPSDPLSLGLGPPFARPGRTALTMAILVLGVTTVTFTVGLTSTAIRYGNLEERHGSGQVDVTRGRSGTGQTASKPAIWRSRAPSRRTR